MKTITEEEAFALDEYYTNNPPRVDPSKARIRIPIAKSKEQGAKSKDKISVIRGAPLVRPSSPNPFTLYIRTRNNDFQATRTTQINIFTLLIANCTAGAVIASRRRSNPARGLLRLDCFVAPLLAMTASPWAVPWREGPVPVIASTRPPSLRA
jgi:hypothetical protein